MNEATAREVVRWWVPREGERYGLPRWECCTEADGATSVKVLVPVLDADTGDRLRWATV